MAKKRHSDRPARLNLNRGPFTGDEIAKALMREGYAREPGGRHPCYSHPKRPGKVQVSFKWTGVKAGSDIFNSLVRQTGYSKDGLLRLLNGISPDEKAS
jgi:hypothetical protein